MSTCSEDCLAYPPKLSTTSFTRDQMLSFTSASLRPSVHIIATLRRFRLLQSGAHIFCHYRGRWAGRRSRVAKSVRKNSTFGLLNIRLPNNKFDYLLDLRADRGIDILLLTETWHDADSLPIRSFLSKGFSVIDRARPRTNEVTLRCNHEGVTIITAPGNILLIIY